MHLIKSLTGLRGYAALLVYIAHMYHFNYFGAPVGVANFLRQLGPGGVSLFFVLSGFVLSINYDWKSLETGRFYVARFARIYPAYFLALIASAPIELLSPDKTGHMTSFAANALLIQQFFPGTSGTWNDVGWPLSVEAFFYLLFPFLVAGFIRGCIRRSMMLTLVVMGVTVVNYFSFQPSFYSSYHFPPNRIFEFLLGITGGLLYAKGACTDLSSRWVAAFFGLGINLFFLTAACIGNLANLSGIPQLFGLSGFLIVFSLALWEQKGLSSGLIISHRILFCGEISYAFYLFHNLILRYFSRGTEQLTGSNPAHWAIIWQLLSAILLFSATFILSAAVFHWFEIPARRFIRRRLSPAIEKAT